MIDLYNTYEALYCVDHDDCFLQCYNRLSCLRTLIYGPSGARLNIGCDSSQESPMFQTTACSEMDIHAGTLLKPQVI